MSRSIIALVTDEDLAYFGGRAAATTQDQVGFLDGGLARFGKSYIGEPDEVAEELREDAAVAAADTLLLTVPNQLGVDYNATARGDRRARRARHRLAERLRKGDDARSSQYTYGDDYLEAREAHRSAHLTVAWQAVERGELLLGEQSATARTRGFSLRRR